MNRAWRSPFVRAAGIGLLVGGIFLLFALDRIQHSHNGDPTGLLHISQRAFDRNPLLMERPDLRAGLLLENGEGYDGQIFYFMAFDPLVTRYSHRPRSYSRVVDSGPYRFGRIGFAWLTRLFSLGRETRYPITMVALVLASLGLCAGLLSLLAQQRGRSAWYGALILLIPGFWQASILTVPEPIAVAFVLAGVLLVGQQRWLLAGLSLGVAMLTRETGGAIVLAIPAAIFLDGRRRESLIVAALAFVPVVLWKGYLGSIFFPIEGMRAFTPHPDDLGLPFGGIVSLWTAVARGAIAGGWLEQLRSGIVFSVLSTAAAVLAAIGCAKRPSPMMAAALFYGLLTIAFNYEAVWGYVLGAQRLTIDLFVAVALAFLVRTEKDPLPRTLQVFWGAMALYILFGMSESADIWRAVF